MAEWKPTKPLEFVVASGAGGGTDNFARTIQSIITKNNLIEAARSSSSTRAAGPARRPSLRQAEQAGDPYKLIFGTNNAYLLPHVAKLAYKPEDLPPVAALALDEFLIWVKAERPTRTSGTSSRPRRQARRLKIGGSQSKDTDQTLVA